MNKEKWVRGSYSYRVKRKNKLFLNVLIEDVNSTYKESHIAHNWILSMVVVENGKVTINYSHFNNRDTVELTKEQRDMVVEYALEISKKYFKDEVKRTVATIQQIDYTSKEEFLKDVPKMKKEGYNLLENTGYNLEPHDVDDEVWKYSAYFIKSDMF